MPVNDAKLVFCDKRLSSKEVFAKIYDSKAWREKPETRTKPEAVVFLEKSPSIKAGVRHDKISILETSIDEVMENRD